MSQMIDLQKQRFGRLFVLRRATNIGLQCAWLCRCDCGGRKVVRGHSLRRGETTSCGCLVREGWMHRTHGKRKTKEYNSWEHMKQRCLNPRNAAYARYGGRGITVCKRWLNSFENFIADMGSCPKGKSLDRWPDNNGNYKRGNCRWATASEQAYNRRPYKLTKSDVVKICKLSAMGITQKVIASRFGIHQSHVSNIVHLKRRAL
jgi:hypothetical protein